MIHELKCNQPYFDDVVSGKKNFEIRKKDRPFGVGDFLALNEYTEYGYTGRCCLVVVKYILLEPEYNREGYCTLGFVPAFIRYNGMPSARRRCETDSGFDFQNMNDDCGVPVYGEHPKEAES